MGIDMKALLAAVVLAAIGSGCAQNYTTYYPSMRQSVAFDSAEAERRMQPGKNSIRGSALLRQRGGGVVNCAGYSVTLTPATAYAAERMAMMYSSRTEGYFPYMTWSFTWANTDPNYLRLQRKTACDAQGSFRFENLADGDYYLETSVFWRVAGESQGGHLMKRVTLRGGAAHDVVLSSL
jgi:hypothetical protein